MKFWLYSSQWFYFYLLQLNPNRTQFQFPILVVRMCTHSVKRMMFRFAEHEPMLCLQNLPERINVTGDWFVTNKLLHLLKILGLFVGFTIFHNVPQRLQRTLCYNDKIFSIKIIENSLDKFGYNEHWVVSFAFLIFLRLIQCMKS